MKKLKSGEGNAFRFFACLVLLFSLLGMASRPPLVGGPAPAFRLQTVDGASAALSDYRDKVVLLNFWATWCEPCKAEMPEIEEAYKAYKNEGFVVLGVNFGEDEDEAASFAHHENLSFPVLLDPKLKVAEQYRVVSLPVTFFVDPQGIIREQVFGGTLKKEQIGGIFHRLKSK